MLVFVVLLGACTEGAEADRTAGDTSTSTSSTPIDDGNATPRPRKSRDECPEGIEGKGLHLDEFYPPKPYFESFNLWRTKTGTGLSHCLIIAAGQQQTHASDGVDDPTVYNPNGWLFIYGDYHQFKDGIGGREVPLQRPVRILLYSGHGYQTLLRLQSLKDCSTIAYEVVSAKFRRDTFRSVAPCPKKARNS
jgi:hypothetical protein